MKRYFTYFCLILLFTPLFITGCDSIPSIGPPRVDFTQEYWHASVDRNAARWMGEASPWFLTGYENIDEAMQPPMPVPNFTDIKIRGPMRVQIDGAADENTVTVFGPKQEVRHVLVEVHNNILCIEVINDEHKGKDKCHMQNVIIRVGVRNLQNLFYHGSGRVEARQIHSNGLIIVANGTNNIYLSGNINLRQVISTNRGCVNVTGARTPTLDIATAGAGSVNVSGNVGIRRIMHHGSGDINIIGANSNGVDITADGRGKIGIYGRMILCNITARDNVYVYAYDTRSGSLRADVRGNARVGIAGAAQDLYVDARDYACFQGRDLCVVNAYIRASGKAHVNVRTTSKLYASGDSRSSIYFFGKPSLIMPFTTGSAVIVPL